MSRQAAIALFLLCFGTYAWFYQAGGWNQNSRFDLTRAIVERGTVRIDAYEANTGDKSLRAGHFYCDKAPGLSWLCVLPAALTPGSPDIRAYVATLFAVAVIPAIALAVYHTVAFGGPLTTAYAFSTQPWRHTGVFMGIGLPRPRAVLHLLFTQYRGIFFSMPWLLLAIPGAVMLIRRRERRADGIVCAAMFLLFFWLNI